MKSNYKFLVAVLGGLVLGAAGKSALHGQKANTPPVCIISEADAITDLAAVKDYGAKVQGTLAPFNGHYHFVASGGKVEGLDGAAPPKGIVIIAFDSSEQAHAWYSSPAYEAIKPIRQSAVKGRMFIVDDVAR